MAADPLLRVSAAALCRVIFPHPHTGEMLLALELRDFQQNGFLAVKAQPFGGALRILDPSGLYAAIGNFDYDSLRSSEEQDLRILIPSSAWAAARQFILAEMGSPQPQVIEADPRRELEEEFSESVGITLLPRHYTYRPIGIFVQDQPLPTTNRRMPGALTVRIYRIYEVVITDPGICQAVIQTAIRFTGDDLLSTAQSDAVRGGKGRVNSVLVLPLEEVHHAYQSVPSQGEIPLIMIRDHLLDITSGLLFEEFQVKNIS